MGSVAKYLVGSQNYGLDNSQSDKDFTFIYMPTWGELFENICHNWTVDEHENYWDYRNFCKYLLRGDFHPIEMIFSVEKEEEIPLSKKLRPYTREIIMSNSSRFFKNVYGLSRSSLEKGQAKGFSRAEWSYRFLNKLLNDDFHINEETFRCQETCEVPRAIRYDKYPFNYQQWVVDMEKLGEEYDSIVTDSNVYFDVNEMLYDIFKKSFAHGWNILNT